MNNFGEKIRKARLEKGWSQEQLAGYLHKRCSGSYITLIEKHGKKPSNTFIADMSACLELDPREMLRLAYREARPEVYEAFCGPERQETEAEPDEDAIKTARLIRQLSHEDQEALAFIIKAMLKKQ